MQVSSIYKYDLDFTLYSIVKKKNKERKKRKDGLLYFLSVFDRVTKITNSIEMSICRLVFQTICRELASASKGRRSLVLQDETVIVPGDKNGTRKDFHEG